MVHKQGSTRVYYQSSTPTLRPDGVTALGSGDAGRLWVDTNGPRLNVWDGSVWTPSVVFPIQFVYIQFYGEYAPGDFLLGTWTNISSNYAGLFFRAEGGAAAAFDGSTQPGSNPGIASSVYPAGVQIQNVNYYDSVTSGNTVRYTTTVEPGTVTGSWYLMRPVNTTIRIWRRTA